MTSRGSYIRQQFSGELCCPILSTTSTCSKKVPATPIISLQVHQLLRLLLSTLNRLAPQFQRHSTIQRIIGQIHRLFIWISLLLSNEPPIVDLPPMDSGDPDDSNLLESSAECCNCCQTTCSFAGLAPLESIASNFGTGPCRYRPGKFDSMYCIHRPVLHSQRSDSLLSSAAMMDRCCLTTSDFAMSIEF